MFSWGENASYVRHTLGQLRNFLGELSGIRAEKRFEWAWIVDFPLFVIGSNGCLESAHHPFTAPMPNFLIDLNESKNLESIRGELIRIYIA